MNHKGTHVFLDFVNFKVERNDLDEICKYVFSLMEDSLHSTSMKNKHSKMVVLKDDTEEGFTSVVLLDESHITAHAYTKQGLLALDVFTCGKTDPSIISKYIKAGLEIKYPTITCTSHQINKRFLH
jgi:S-adenosylmethionine/arginine decarboxylase-like enzyme